MSRAVVTVGLSFLALGGGCRGPEPPPPTPLGLDGRADAPEPYAITETTSLEPSRAALEVPLVPRSGSSLAGKASFLEVPEGVRVTVEVSGVPPGRHGAHIHERADCSAADAKSAGEHFSPDGHPHALPPTQPRHIGDLGNLEVGADGAGRLELVATGANLREGDRHSFVGRAIVVHAKADDGSQPSGSSGERIGCGEIRRR